MSVAELVANNQRYVQHRPAHHSEVTLNRIFTKTLIITCMDPRVNIEQATGLDIGGTGDKSAAVIRCAGGRARLVERDMIIVQLLVGQPVDIMVVHHSHCGGIIAPDKQTICSMIENGTTINGGHWKCDARSATSSFDLCGWDRKEGESDDELLERSIIEDVAYLRRSPFVMEGAEVSGWIFETETGKLIRVDG